MSEAETKTGIAAVAQAAKAARGLPPVHLWNPAHCGDIDIAIRADGTWMHEGSPIGRAELVRLFSTVLRLDPDGYHLVTPVEKLMITVEDLPFRAVAMRRDGEDLVFTTDVGDEVRAGPENPITVETDPTTGEPAPRVYIRRGLEARIVRTVFYDLVEMAEERDGRLAVSSGGVWFPLGPPGAGLA
ncbi:DUF1285 domain-containing protein [Brevundimonas bacteroides]|uniref:DUF1285 domain-containing protein n=1 Tax=Brevundimonas bacteroides TaxID=74311 RepID=UPI00049607B0|nr:DUF1285 domain-containing protein [Brevundimonas bacteroides]